MNALEAACADVLKAFAPPPKLSLPVWLERNIVLPDAMSAAPGRLRLWPWQRALAAAISDPAIERVTVVKAARLGYTTVLNGAIAAFAINEPSSMLLLMPTESDCRDHVVTELEPLCRASPALRGLLSEDSSERNSRNTLLFRQFPGGTLKIVAAHAPRNLRRHTARFLFCDEIDAMPVTAEGDPLALAAQRTATFPNRKLIYGSTPTDLETSPILALYAASDQRIFECACPHCGAFAEITWSCIEWEPGNPDSASFRCPHCKALVAERYKRQMVDAGRWRVTHPEIAEHAGFKISALVSLSPHAAWSKLATEFLRAKDAPDLLQPFVNTVLAEGWRAAGAVDEAALSTRVEPFDLDRMPAEVLALSAGSDVQDDRIETVILGWTRDGVCLALGYNIVWGSYTDPDTWSELDDLLKSRWRHPLGGELKIDAAVIDAGDGDHYDAVLNFAGPRISRRIFAGKGVFGNRPGFAMAKGRKVGGRLAIIGVDVLKSEIVDKLSRGVGIRFSESLEPVFFEQLASERRVIRYKRGMPTRRFERISDRARAEALDATVYGFAARRALGTINFDSRERALRDPTAKRPSPASRLAGAGAVSIKPRDAYLRNAMRDDRPARPALASKLAR